MSLRSLKAELDALRDRMLDRIQETVEQHGLDPDADEVHEVITQVFGDAIRAAYENEVS